jgi:hypothetical protein
MGDELGQARGDIRQTLILLGEGASLDFGYYIADYFEKPLGGYGYYYNLDLKVRFGSDRIAPKPAAPAFAALTYVMDGSQSDGQLQGVGQDCLAYLFTRGNRKIIAVWSYGSTPIRSSLPVEAPTVTIIDWMGNSRVVRSDGGTIQVTAGPDPQYVVYDLVPRAAHRRPPAR